MGSRLRRPPSMLLMTYLRRAKSAPGSLCRLILVRVDNRLISGRLCSSSRSAAFSKVLQTSNSARAHSSSSVSSASSRHSRANVRYFAGVITLPPCAPSSISTIHSYVLGPDCIAAVHAASLRTARPQIEATAPNRKWIADFTYVRTGGGLGHGLSRQYHLVKADDTLRAGNLASVEVDHEEANGG